MYFSYGQFLLYDSQEDLPGCAWEEPHFRQGFARRRNCASFLTLDQFGDAKLDVTIGPYRSRDHHVRVIAVSIEIDSGLVMVEGPEEYGENRGFRLAPGTYRVTVGQSEFSREIDISFDLDGSGFRESEILLCDDDLEPSDLLLEECGVAGGA
ncbi:MAG: competence protein ComJ [Phycisphaerales bacterium]